MREKLGRRLECYTTSALNNNGLKAHHRDFTKADSHSGTDVTTESAVIECKNLALNKYHKCGYKWTLNKIVNRFTLNDGLIHILVISYRSMLTESAQSLLEALNIHIVEVGIQVSMHNTLATIEGRLAQTQLAQSIKTLLNKSPDQTNKDRITTQNITEYPYAVSYEDVYELSRGVNSITTIDKQQVINH